MSCCPLNDTYEVHSAAVPPAIVEPSARVRVPGRRRDGGGPGCSTRTRHRLGRQRRGGCSLRGSVRGTCPGGPHRLGDRDSLGVTIARFLSWPSHRTRTQTVRRTRVGGKLVRDRGGRGAGRRGRWLNPERAGAIPRVIRTSAREPPVGELARPPDHPGVGDEVEDQAEWHPEEPDQGPQQGGDAPWRAPEPTAVALREPVPEAAKGDPENERSDLLVGREVEHCNRA